MTSIELLARLAALLPPPRYPLTRYHGVLAPRSAWRREIVPRAPASSAKDGAPVAANRRCSRSPSARARDRPRAVEGSPTRPLAVFAPRPAAWAALPFFQLLLGPANAARSGHRELRVLDPADELVPCQGRDVRPGSERRGVCDQRLTQVHGQLVDHATGHALAGHVASRRARAVGGQALRSFVIGRAPPPFRSALPASAQVA